jgi:hypothetical protein
MGVLLTYLVMIGLASCWIAVDEKLFAPKRRDELNRRVTAIADGQRIVALASGVIIGGEDDPDFDLLFAATDRCLIYCSRRRGSSVKDRWDDDVILWEDVRPLVVRCGTSGDLSIYLLGQRADGDAQAMLAAARPHLSDPSGHLEIALKICCDEGLVAVVHGGRGKDPSAPCLIGCTSAGIVIAEKRKARVIPWAAQPTVAISAGPPSKVVIRHGRRRFELQTPILGDSETFVTVVAASRPTTSATVEPDPASRRFVAP